MRHRTKFGGFKWEYGRDWVGESNQKMGLGGQYEGLGSDWIQREVMLWRNASSLLYMG